MKKDFLKKRDNRLFPTESLSVKIVFKILQSRGDRY